MDGEYLQVHGYASLIMATQPEQDSSKQDAEAERHQLIKGREGGP
jgi:hypothetical protein